MLRSITIMIDEAGNSNIALGGLDASNLSHLRMVELTLLSYFTSTVEMRLRRELAREQERVSSPPTSGNGEPVGEEVEQPTESSTAGVEQTTEV